MGSTVTPQDYSQSKGKSKATLSVEQAEDETVIWHKQVHIR